MTLICVFVGTIGRISVEAGISCVITCLVNSISGSDDFSFSIVMGFVCRM